MIRKTVYFEFKFLDAKCLERFDVEEEESREERLPDNKGNYPNCSGNLGWSCDTIKTNIIN